MHPGYLSTRQSCEVHTFEALLNPFSGELTTLPETSFPGPRKVRTEWGVCCISPQR